MLCSYPYNGGEINKAAVQCLINSHFGVQLVITSEFSALFSVVNQSLVTYDTLCSWDTLNAFLYLQAHTFHV